MAALTRPVQALYHRPASEAAQFALPALARLEAAPGKPQVLVLAPTRELAIQVAEAEPILTERGVAVRVFNLVDLRNSHGFNPLRYVDEEAPETSIAQLAEGIVMNTSGSKDGPGKDAFWDRAERALLTALIAYVWATTPEAEDHEASLADVVDLHKRMASGEGKAAKVQSEVDLEMQAAREVVAEYHANPPRMPSGLA